jgi:multiple sugar transport system permease protein
MNKKFTIKTFIILIITLLILSISLFPYYYMLMQSLVDWAEVDKNFFSTNISLKSYKYLLLNGNSANPYMWYKALLNSLIVSLPTTIISIMSGLLIGYSAAQVKFSGSKLIYNTLLFQMFFPTIILLVPRYILMKPLANSYLGMILPLSVSLWAVFMYINYFKTLPDSIFEAARIDGASETKILINFGIPFSKSVTTIVFLTTFMSRWSELMWDMIIAPDARLQTLNVLISTQFRPMGNLPGPMYAASVILTLPIVVLFLLFSKHFKEGINFMLK